MASPLTQRTPRSASSTLVHPLCLISLPSEEPVPAVGDTQPLPTFSIIFCDYFPIHPLLRAKKLLDLSARCFHDFKKSALHLGIMCTAHTSGPNHHWREEGTRNVMKKFLHNFVIFWKRCSDVWKWEPRSVQTEQENHRQHRQLLYSNL